MNQRRLMLALPLLLLLLLALLARLSGNDKAAWLPLLWLGLCGLAALLALLALLLAPSQRAALAQALLALALPLLYGGLVIAAGRMGWIDPGNWIGVR